MCDHVRLPNGGVAIVCGLRRKKRQRCAFCGNPADKLCDWKTEKPTDIPHAKLQMGDVIETRQQKHHLPVRQVVRFVVVTAGVRYPVTMYGLQFPDGRCWVYYLWGKDKARVLRPGTCDKPCCDTCSREAGEDKDYCKDHWQAWEFPTSLDQTAALPQGEV